MDVIGRIVVPGEARGPLLRIDEPLSFWGGVDPATGRITDPRSSAYGKSVTGTVLALRATRGSSSSSSVMLELLYGRIAPAALVMQDLDAILVLGVLVAREMGWPAIPVLRADWRQIVRIDGERAGRDVVIADDRIAIPLP